MSQSEKLRSLYQAYLECCNKHDVEGMAAFYASTMKINDVPMNKASVAAQFPPLFTAFPDWHWEMRHLIIDGDYILGPFTVTGTHHGSFQGIKATGRRVTASEFTLYHVEGAKFAEVWDLTEMDAVMKQIRQDERH